MCVLISLLDILSENEAFAWKPLLEHSLANASHFFCLVVGSTVYDHCACEYSLEMIALCFMFSCAATTEPVALAGVILAEHARG